MPLNHLKLRHPELVETEKGLPAQRQLSLLEAFSGQPFTADKSTKLTEQLTSMRHEGFCPLTTVEHSGFQAVVKFLKNRIIQVSRLDNFHSSSGKKYKDVLDWMKTVLSKQPSISLTMESQFHDGDRPLFEIRVDIRRNCVEPAAQRRLKSATRL